MRINILLIKEHADNPPVWAAVCLEHHIAAQSSTPKEALNEICLMFAGQVAPEAPSFYQEMFEKAVRIHPEEHPLCPRPPSLPAAYLIPELSDCRVAA